MTTLIAFATKQSGMVLCADLRVTHNNRLLTDSASKIVYSKNSVSVAAAGNWGAIGIVAALLIDHEADMPIPNNSYTATKFALWLRGLLLDNDLRPDVDPSEKDYTVGMLPCEFLITTTNGIITITAGLDVYINTRFASLGSGAPFALGAMSALHSSGSDYCPQAFAKRIYAIVASLDTDTSADFDLVVASGESND